jgi:hypothetical protein
MKITLNVLDESLKLPERCAITGETDDTLQKRPVVKSYWFLFEVLRTSYPFPMTEKGWELYRKSLTWVDKSHNGYAGFCVAIPLLGWFLYACVMIYLWPLLIINAIYKWFRKDKLKISVSREGEIPFARGVKMEVPSEKFGEEFVKLNSHLGAKVV